MSEIELMPCPDCNGEIKIWTASGRGAFSECQKCGKEVDICGWDKIPLYCGCKIRKSTVNKIKRMWNRMAERRADIDRTQGGK